MSLITTLSFKNDSSSKLIDARGPRFGAALTTLALTLFLVTNFLPLLYWQLAVFTVATFAGLKYSPYAVLYSRLVKPRLRGDLPSEDIRPPQFAQLVGFLFAATATVFYLLGAEQVGFVVISFALAAAFLNAAFNFCLGCEVYLLIARLKSAVSSRSNREDSYNLPAL